LLLPMMPWCFLLGFRRACPCSFGCCLVRIVHDTWFVIGSNPNGGPLF
jgi:hypothetical protein